MIISGHGVTWDEVELGDIVTLHRGYDLPSAQRRSGTIPVVSSSGITGHHDEPKVQPPGVVTGRYGTLGEVFFIEEPFWPLNTTLFVSDFHGNDERFVSYLLRAAGLGDHDGAAAVPGINRNVLHRLPTRRPPIQTQRKIASVLSAYDDLIAINSRRIDILAEEVDRIYREWFVDFRYPGHEKVPLVDSELGPLPRGWTVVALGTVSAVKGGLTETKASFVDQGYTAYSAAGPDGFLVDYEVDGAGVVLSAVGARCGRTWYATGKWTSIANTLSIRPVDGTSTAEWLYCVTLGTNNWIRRGSAQPFIAINDVRARRVVAPPFESITAFTDRVLPFMRQADVLRASGRKLRAARDLLLPRLISGEIDVAALDIRRRELAA